MADLTFSIKRIRAARVYSDPDPESGGSVRFGPAQWATRRCVAEMKTFWLCFVAQLAWNNKEKRNSTSKTGWSNLIVHFCFLLLCNTWPAVVVAFLFGDQSNIFTDIRFQWIDFWNNCRVWLYFVFFLFLRSRQVTRFVFEIFHFCFIFHNKNITKYKKKYQSVYLSTNKVIASTKLLHSGYQIFLSQ